MQRFAGLRYRVRRSLVLPDGPGLYERPWEVTLFDYVRQDARGWHFDWCGEHVSSPVRHLQHTDGRVGVADANTFIPVYPTMLHLIESHALFDAYADWEPFGLSVGFPLDRLRVELPIVREASGPWARWYADGELALHENLMWTSIEPRRWRLSVWAREAIGRRRLGGIMLSD
ncbi:hypothetical protein [Yinghuangia sp. YIM S09857]|uniref:hypothetical protein n=1 Tax=Yinghuangia sp. YIM S09857 TaxID=3436929 RepID=UPI003F531B30